MNRLIIMILAIGTLSLGFQSCGNNKKAKGEGGSLSVDAFEKQLAETPNAQLLDVRTPEEFNGGHLKGAVNADVNGSDFETKVNALDKSKPVFVYCLSGGRSAGAAGFLRKNGFNTVYEMPGIMAWNAAGKPLVTDDAGAAPAKTGMSAADYQKAVSGDKYVLVDFNAVWCKPCKQLSPILEKIAADKKDKLVLLKIDADENAGLLQEKGIDGIPYLELYKDGKLVWSHKGLINEFDLLKESGLN